jgi:hypothetical protein
MAHRDLSDYDVIEVLGFERRIYTHRVRKPASWTIDEIGLLASSLGYSTASIKTIEKLIMHLSLLAPSDQKWLYKQAGLDQNKLQVRRQNYNHWKLEELEKLAQALEIYESVSS